MRTTLLPLPVAFLALAACNEPPGAPQITLNPGEPTTTDDVTVLFLALTADGNKDEVTHTFQWFQDGTLRPDLTTDTLPASETTKGETWKVVVVPNDGELDGEAAEASATVVNTPPVATVSLAADPATDADLEAVVASEDADTDTVTYTYAWTRDGQAVTRADARIPASETAHGETWVVTVTPNDGEEDGEPVTASVVVANTAPMLERVELAPQPAYEGTVLTATAFGVDDLDEDGVTLTYTWFVNDTEVQSGDGDTLTGVHFDKHDLVRVEVTPTDGYVDGATVASDDLIVENTVPSGTSVVILSSSGDGLAYEGSTLTCTPSGWTDDDGDAEGWTFAWQVDGATASTSATIDGTLVDKGDVVACVATPNDGEASGSPLTSSAVRVENSLPVLASATLSTTAPTESDTVGVTLGAATDADGDAVSYRYAWSVDGVLVSTAESLLPSRFAKGDTIQVTVTPYDGTDLGAEVASATAIAANSAPSVRAVTLSPSAVYTNDTLTASASSSDLDGDGVSLTYDWTVNGIPVGASGASLDGGVYFDKGDVVAVTVTPTDGEDLGAGVTSSSVTVRNTAPTAPVVAIDPADASEGDTLLCDVTTESTDADGDTVTYTFAWEQDGATFASAGATVWTGDTVAGSYVQDLEEWTCSVTASDGAAASSAVEDAVVVGGIGESASNPGLSCLDILDRGGSVGDGTYWVSPDGAAAYQVYCDMTTDGGGWTLMAKFSQHTSISAMSSTMYNNYFYTNLWIDGYAERVPTSPVPTYDTYHVESVDWSDFMAAGSAHELRQRFFKGAGTSVFDVSYGFTYNGYTDQNSTSGSNRAWQLTGRNVHEDSSGIAWHTPAETVRFYLPFKVGIEGTSVYYGCGGYSFDSRLCSHSRPHGGAGIIGASADAQDPAAAYAPFTEVGMGGYDVVYIHESGRGSSVYGRTSAQMTLLYYIR